MRAGVRLVDRRLNGCVLAAQGHKHHQLNQFNVLVKTPVRSDEEALQPDSVRLTTARLVWCF